MTQEYTISLFTEDHIGILSQITIILTRRQINIESITASESAVKGVQMLTLVVRTTPEMVQKVSRQMQKLVDVLIHAFSPIGIATPSERVTAFRGDVDKELSENRT